MLRLITLFALAGLMLAWTALLIWQRRPAPANTNWTERDVEWRVS